MVKLKGIILDFINYAFLLSLIAFVIIYIIVGDRFKLINQIMEAFMPVAFFAVVFLFKAKNSRDELQKFKEEDNLDEIIIYFDNKDLVKDYIAIGLLPICLFILALADANIDLYDLVQIFIAVALMTVAHIFLFRLKETVPVTRNATRLNKLVDDMLIYLLPLSVLSVCFFKLSVNLVDFLQAIIAFAIFFIWRKILFRHAN